MTLQAPARPGVAAPPAGLYLHVPFCVSHCPYCDFVVLAGREARGPANRIGAFVDALVVELELRADALDARWGKLGARPPLDTVYLGGGTPSLLPASTVGRLLDLVRQRFGLASGAEVTLEVNPGPDERGDAAGFAAAGVTRMSIGAQSFDAGELAALGRRHRGVDVVDTVRAARAARAAGVASVSLDLLYDIPGQSLDTWSRTLDAALALDPDHMSIYALTLDDPDLEGLTGDASDHLPLSRGARRWREKSRGAQDDDRAAAMYELADRRLADAGFAWYEISSWARPGQESRHNRGYWRALAWEAVGPGAHAFDGETRRWNVARLDGYLASLTPADGTDVRVPPGGEEPVDASRNAADRWILALRTSDGLPLASLDDHETPLASTLRWAIDAGLAQAAGGVTGGRVVLTLRGRLLANEIFARLI